MAENKNKVSAQDDKNPPGFFQNILRFFKKKKDNVLVSEDIQTRPLSDAQLIGVENVNIQFHPLQVGVGTSQSSGRLRDNNEDTLFAFNSILADGREDLPFGLFIVSDGMGGHKNGELASRTAVRVVAEVLMNRFFVPKIIDFSEGSSEPIHELIESAIREAQYAVNRQAPGGGTTLTAALLLGDKIILVHIGDSRAYFLYPDGRIQAVTQDHSYVRRLVELGQLTEEEAAIHPQRNVLYRALGQAEPFKADINTYEVPRPGALVVCSDGLWGLVSENEIFRLVTSTPNPSDAAHQLVELANSNGGPDNISVIVVQFYN